MNRERPLPFVPVCHQGRWGLVHNAQAMAEGMASIRGVQVVNDVVYTQVCLRFGDDARTRAVTVRLIADGTVWMSGSRWCDQDVLRISVSNWATDATDVSRSVDAVRRAVDAAGK
jgi:threonine aldolase